MPRPAAKHPNGFVIERKVSKRTKKIRYHVSFNASGKHVFGMQPKGYARRRSALNAVRVAKNSSFAKIHIRG